MEIADAAVRPERRGRLVLRAAMALMDGPALPLGLDRPLAPDGTRVAGLAVLEDRGGHRGAADLLVVLELAGVVVEGRQAARRVLSLEHALGSVDPQVQDVAVVRDLVGAPAGELAEGRGVGEGQLLAGAAHDDGLEVLGAHHRAHAGAAVGAVGHVHDRGEADQLLAGRAGLGDLDLVVTELGLEEIVHLGRGPAPQVTGGAQLGLAVVEPQVDGLRRPPGDDESDEAGEVELGREEAACLAVADAVGEGRAGIDRDPALAGDRRPGQEAVHHGQHVGRIEPVRARLHPLEDVVEPHRGAAEVGPEERLGRVLVLERAGREVDVQDASGDDAWHSAASASQR